MFKITQEPIDEQSVISEVQDSSSGATVTFMGIVRDISRGKKVIKLYYEGHESMAESRMKKIADETKQNYEVCKVAVQHRIGMLMVGDIAVVIAVSAPHRAAAFQACQFVIDRIKEDVPVWKKEYYDDGSHWIHDQ